MFRTRGKFASNHSCYQSDVKFYTTSNECKRRKIKCDGEEPCQRCVKSMTLCSYQRSSRNRDSRTGQSPAADAVLAQERTQNALDRELRQMSEQLRTVMDKVDCLNERLGSVSPPGPSHLPQQSTTSIHIARDQANQQCSPGQLSSPKARDRPMEAATIDEQETIVPEYHGPTSSEFTFEVANESLNELRVECSASNSNQAVECLYKQDIPGSP